MQTLKEYCRQAVEAGWVWVALKYNLTGDPPPVKYSTTCNFAKFHVNLGRVVVRLDVRARVWLTYKKPTVGLWANAVPCTLRESVTLQAVHEFTHYAQYATTDRSRNPVKYSEVEATQNEIEYAKVNYPHLYKKLEVVK